VQSGIPVTVGVRGLAGRHVLNMHELMPNKLMPVPATANSCHSKVPSAPHNPFTSFPHQCRGLLIPAATRCQLFSHYPLITFPHQCEALQTLPCSEELRQTKLAAAAAAGVPSSSGLDLTLTLNQELIAARVALEAAARRFDLVERGAARAAVGEAETKERLAEAEARAATVEGDLATARAIEMRLRALLQVPRDLGWSGFIVYCKGIA